MSSCIVNVNHMKKCAFCKNWYDPMNSAIMPKSPAIGLWEIKDVNHKSLCLAKNIQMSANAFCSDSFVNKL